MVEGVQFAGVKIAAAGFVTDKSVVVPAVPQIIHQVVALVCALAGRLAGYAPGGAAVGQVVEGGEFAGDVVRLVVVRAGDEANVLGDGGQRRHQGQRFKLFGRFGEAQCSECAALGAAGEGL